jgi:hypothetical protein
VTELIHLVVRESDGGQVYATSPQAPGLVYGRESIAELRQDLADVLTFRLDRQGPFRVVEHREHHYDISDRELVIRLALDNQEADRRIVRERIGRALGHPEQAEALLAGVPNATGEAVYVCAVPSDTIGWLEAQFDPRGDAFTAALAIADGLVLTLPFAMNDGLHPSWHLISDGPDTKLSEVMRRSMIVTPPQLVHLEYS